MKIVRWIFPAQLTKKRAIILALTEIAALILHNAVFALFEIEEVVFFLLAVCIIPLYTLYAGIITLKEKLNK